MEDNGGNTKVQATILLIIAKVVFFELKTLIFAQNFRGGNEF
jgi:hypothetical protein